MDPYARALLDSEPLRGPLVGAAIQALRLPAGSQGLDAGCGIGLQSLCLVRAVGPDGRVTGLDASETLLGYARENLAQSGLSERITLRQGDWNALPFEEAAFDWAWSADGMAYRPDQPGREVRELTRVVKPGGKVALLVWSSQVFLPGYPVLEAHLNASAAGIAPFKAGVPPENHFLRLLSWLRAAGLQCPSVETFAGSAAAPLAPELRAALAALLEMRWAGAEAELSPADRELYLRLCRPDSPEYILNLPDYYAFFTCSLFWGTAAG
jgi:demethylmenaquinone methyltransferase/2-methoxy-6-polyprenyl-1,4-benzoquinol methylase